MKEETRTKFLPVEYDQCFNQMRHYDNMKISLLTFAFSFYSAIGTAAFALYQVFSDDKLHMTQMFLSILSFFVFAVGLVIVFMLVKNRKYFVLVTRQVNEIRNFFLSKEDNTEYRNMLPADSSMPKAFELTSTHILTIFLLSLINSSAMLSTVFFLAHYLDMRSSGSLALVSGVVALIMQIAFSRAALKNV